MLKEDWMMRSPLDIGKSIDGRSMTGKSTDGAAAAGPPAPALKPVPGPGWGACLAVAALVLVAACSETITKHGHQFQDNDLKSIASGMSQEQVKTTLGSPTTTATVGSGSAYYYISSTQGQSSFFKPVEKDRKVLAVYFNQLGSVDRVAHYGIKDGKVFDFANQKTPTPSRDEGLLKALFRNLGAKQFGVD
jgi:outer membrane protein assembly factor BamE (lipoprotein component of BamABCDE complex)